jgi:UDP-N-acetylmuramoylalanine--D-glutamate ligase
MTETFFHDLFGQQSICLLGFGREGRSTFRTLQKYLTFNKFIIADANDNTKEIFLKEFGHQVNVEFFCGKQYTSGLEKADVVIKSPGVSIKSLKKDGVVEGYNYLSQTEIFLRLYRKQIIGVTGTKGKSTTVSLIYTILKQANRDVLLVGNIGVPPFDLLEEINKDTVIVFEMSSHQLHTVKLSPGIAVLLNIFQDHLDYYDSYEDYQQSKLNITRWQQPGDTFVFNAGNELLNTIFNEIESPATIISLNPGNNQSNKVYCKDDGICIELGQKSHFISRICRERLLQGSHNLLNIAAAATVAFIMGIPDDDIRKTVATFSGLPHRLEFVKEIKGVRYYNDSISTIPEATIEALKTFQNVKTLLVGGFDRGIDYSILIDYLGKNPVDNIIFIGEAGKRIRQELLANFTGKKDSVTFWHGNFESAVNNAMEVSLPGTVCLLSPAAASYDMFKNFEERGDKFRKMILQNE